jgi:hypothetical protein
MFNRSMHAFYALMLFATVGFQSATAEASPEAIRKFAGCYEVTFNFAETFAFSPDYKFHDRYQSKGLEWIVVDEDSQDRITLQHVLITPNGLLKHWRQEWLLEPQSHLEFKGNLLWTKKHLAAGEANGQWVQKVYQVDDSPRYECVAPWVQWGSESYWECQAWSPLPRREFSKRSDYNVLNRRNRQAHQSWGWMHEQDNVKLVVASGAVTPLAKEKGEVPYVRVDAARCESAEKGWPAMRSVWRPIQAAWYKTYASNETLQFIKVTSPQPLLWQALFALADRATQATMTSQEIENEALAIIQSYLAPAKSN